MKISIACLVGLLAASEAVPSTILEPWTRLGATAVLGAALLFLISKTIPRMTKDFRDSLDVICNRHDKWEQVRHDDQQRLERLLVELEKK